MTSWERDHGRKENSLYSCTSHYTFFLDRRSHFFIVQGIRHSSCACWGCWLRSERDSPSSSKACRASLESAGQQDSRRMHSHIPYDSSLQSVLCQSRVIGRPRYWFFSILRAVGPAKLVNSSRQGPSALKWSHVLTSECHTCGGKVALERCSCGPDQKIF